MPVRLTGDVPRSCPRPCGQCCRTLWQTVPPLEHLTPAPDGSCPFLGLLGCRLQTPPLPCMIYLCDLAEACVEHHITKFQFKRLQKLRARKAAMITGTNEKVLCVSSKTIKGLMPPDKEFVTDAKVLSEVITHILQHYTILDRDLAEYDPEWRQVIPYQIVQNYNAHPAEYLLMQRTKKQTEERLHEKLSLGIGGHINPIDDTTKSIITSNMLREREEEISIDVYTESLLGVIACDTNEVDRVHLGLVFMLGCRANFEIREKENMTAHWARLLEITDAYFKLERWSQLVVTYLRERSR